MGFSISNKILASAKQKVEATGSTRADLAVADYRITAADGSQGKILVSYSGETPTVRELVNFVMAKYEGKAFPLAETACNYGELKCVAVTCCAPELKRSVSDKSRMMKITASTFMDVADKSEWKVRTNPTTGVSYLSRALVEDFDKILASKKQNIGMNSVTASTNFSRVTASYLQITEGDYVKFFDGTSQTGVVKSIEPSGDTCKVMSDDGEVHVISTGLISEIVRKDDGEKKRIEENMKEFYMNIWPKEFVEGLFKA